MHFGIMGLMGSGKDTAAEYLVAHHGYTQVAFRDMVVEEAEERGLEPTRENLQDVQERARMENGDDYFARKMVDAVAGVDKAVVTGFRPPVDAETLKARFGDDIILVLLEVDQRERARRLMERGRPDDPESFEEFRAQDERDMEFFDFDETFEYADVAVSNDDSVEELYERLDGLVEEYSD